MSEEKSDDPPSYHEVVNKVDHLIIEKGDQKENEKAPDSSRNSNTKSWMTKRLLNSPFPRYKYAAVLRPGYNQILLVGGFDNEKKFDTGIWTIFSHKDDFVAESPDNKLISLPFYEIPSWLKNASVARNRDTLYCPQFQTPFSFLSIIIFPTYDRLLFYKPNEIQYLDCEVSFGDNKLFDYGIQLVWVETKTYSVLKKSQTVIREPYIYIIGGENTFGHRTNTVTRISLKNFLSFSNSKDPTSTKNKTAFKEKPDKLPTFEKTETFGEPLPPLSRHGMCEWDSNLYIFGGVVTTRQETPKLSNDLYKLDININEWTKVDLKAKNEMIPPMADFACLRVDDFWVINGGRTENGISPFTYFINLRTNSCIKLDPVDFCGGPTIGICEHQMVYLPTSGEIVILPGYQTRDMLRNQEVEDDKSLRNHRRRFDDSSYTRFTSDIYVLNFRKIKEILI